MATATARYSTSVIPFDLIHPPDTIRTRRLIPEAVSLPRDPESGAVDPFPDPLQKLYMGVLRAIYLDIVRDGPGGLPGLTAEDLAEWAEISRAIGLCADFVPRLQRKGLEDHFSGKKVML